MVWTETTREQYRRGGRGYASDTTDAEWLLLSFFLPPRCRVGRPREVCRRQGVNAILYVNRTGCQWRQLPRDFRVVVGLAARGQGQLHPRGLRKLVVVAC